MQDLAMSPATVAVLAALAAWAIWAVRRMTHRGLCDCGDHCGDGGCAGGCGGSCGCGAADKMLANMEKALK